MKYSEEDIKTQITNAFFPKGRFVIYKNKLDFAVADKSGNPIFWAESKKGKCIISKWAMLAQLILTIKPRLDSGEMPPAFIGCFDEQEISFCEFYHVQDILTTNDFDWSERPSNVSKKSADKVASILGDNVFTFDWQNDIAAAKEFVKNNLHMRGLFEDQSLIQYIQITKNNFVQIFNRWRNDVLPSIAVPPDFYKNGLIDGDFFLADVLSDKNKTIAKKLNVLLNQTEYKVAVKVQNMDLFREIHFRDNGKAHKKFWDYYIRPPKEEYWEYIRERRDLLVPSGIRERKGAFFTPQIWVQKSQEYIARAFGENWQDEYFVWDCCAGTGNLLEGLVNPERIWASTLDEPDVRVMKENPRLLENHCFQFDFLNDDFSKLPEKLLKIIKENPEKLIIYINPPYGECGHEKSGKNKEGIANNNKVHERFEYLGRALRDIATLFMARIKIDIKNCNLCIFNKLKYITGPNFSRFRDLFRAEYKVGFIVKAETFDNVKGKFPISFLIWKTKSNNNIKSIECDVLDNDKELTQSQYAGIKKFFVLEEETKLINDWLDTSFSKRESIGYLNCKANDFQHNQNVVLVTTIAQTSLGDKAFNIAIENLIESVIYLSVRHCIPADWLNDRDQFLYPNDDWQNDYEFQNDCLIFTLFHSQNRIDSRQGINHWIPFKPSEVGASEDFASNFMSDFINTRGSFSKDAQKAFDAAKELWKFYQNAIRGSYGANVNASLYEIREYFRGRTNSGRLKPKSENSEFQILDDDLKFAISNIAPKIAKCVYKYGFLKK